MHKLFQTKKQVTSSSTSTDPGDNHDRARLTRKGTLVRNMKALLDGGFGTSRATASPPISTTGSPKGFVHQRNKSLPNPPFLPLCAVGIAGILSSIYLAARPHEMEGMCFELW